MRTSHVLRFMLCAPPALKHRQNTSVNLTCFDDGVLDAGVTSQWRMPNNDVIKSLCYVVDLRDSDVTPTWIMWTSQKWAELIAWNLKSGN